MFRDDTHKSSFWRVWGVLDIIYHSAVRSVRKTHSNAVMAIFVAVAQKIVLVAVFFMLFSLLGLRGMAIRGDFVLYVMSGVFLFRTHVATVGAVVAAEGPNAPIMKHAPLNSVISIASVSLAQLYINVIAVFVVLFLYHAVWQPITIHDPIGAMAMLLLAWFSAVAVGTIFLAIKPWFPSFVSITSMLYSRANMIFSGKMFVANSLPAHMLPLFDWNPLFHVIDQARGFTFINYNPHFTSITYPLAVSAVLIVLGMMGEFYTRQRASISWAARQ